ncbi:MAG: hypothetical protein FJX76_02955 [Armatimonadetes bacterium]|nr:hypothetical protein [Armatimonadota bacterium]
MWKPDVRMSQRERDLVRAGSRKCPRCNVVLGPRNYASVSVDCCPSCEGLWFDDGEVRMIVDRFKKGARGGDTDLVQELRQGMSAEESKGGLFSSLREFLRSARSS